MVISILYYNLHYSQTAMKYIFIINVSIESISAILDEFILWQIQLRNQLNRRSINVLITMFILYHHNVKYQQ